MKTVKRVKPVYIAVLAGAASLMMPLAVQAQEGPEFSGTLTLGFSNSSVGGLPTDIDLSALSFDVETDVMFSDAIGVGLDLSYSTGTLDVSGLGEADLDLLGMSIEPVYSFANGAYVGAYYLMGDLDLSAAGLPVALGVDTEGYGLFAGHETDALWLEGFLGTSDADSSLSADFDIRDYGFAASYDITSQTEIFGSVVRTDIDALGESLNLTAWSVGAEYDFGNGLSAYGSLGLLDIDLGPLGEFDTVGLTIGAAYGLDMQGTPIVLNAEYSHTNINGIQGIEPDIDRFAIGVTIPLGNGSSEPLNSNTATARGDYRSAIAALANSL